LSDQFAALKAAGPSTARSGTVQTALSGEKPDPWKFHRYVFRTPKRIEEAYPMKSRRCVLELLTVCDTGKNTADSGKC